MDLRVYVPAEVKKEELFFTLVEGDGIGLNVVNEKGETLANILRITKTGRVKLCESIPFDISRGLGLQVNILGAMVAC